VAHAVDLSAVLVAAGLKDGLDSRDVVVAPQGTAATIFFAATARNRVASTEAFLARENWAARVFAGERLAEVGLPTDTALQVAVALATDDRVNPHGVPGFGAIVSDPNDPEGRIGFGQHGGLGANEQRPFLTICGGGFVPGERVAPSSLCDIAPTVLRHLRMDHDDMDGRALPLER
jgi:hypothetical protein